MMRRVFRIFFIAFAIVYNCEAMNERAGEEELVRELKEAFIGKRPLYSITLTRKRSSVLQSAERYFLGKIIESFLNDSSNELDVNELKGYIVADIKEFITIDSSISENIQQEISACTQKAAEEISKEDKITPLKNIKKGLIDGTYQSSTSKVSAIIETYKEQTSLEGIRANLVNQLHPYEKSIYEKKYEDINKYICTTPERVHKIDSRISAEPISVNRIRNALIGGKELSSSIPEIQKIITRVGPFYRKSQKCDQSARNLISNWLKEDWDTYIEFLENSYQKAWNKVQSIKQKYASKFVAIKDNYGFVVLNEMFFGKNIPYDKEKTDQLNDFVTKLSSICGNKILFINLLSTKKCILQKPTIEQLEQKFGEELKILDEIKEGNYKNCNKLTNLFQSKIELKEYIQNLRSYIGKECTQLNNTTNAFFKGRRLYFYNKSSYFQECDLLLGKGGLLYDFGDTLNHVANKSQVADFLKENILNAICYDFNVGIHKNMSCTQKIYILQSNTLSLNGCHNNMPQKSHFLIHSDPNVVLAQNLQLCKTDFYMKNYIENIETNRKESFVLENSGTLSLAALIPVLNETYVVSIRDISREMAND